MTKSICGSTTLLCYVTLVLNRNIMYDLDTNCYLKLWYYFSLSFIDVKLAHTVIFRHMKVTQYFYRLYSIKIYYKMMAIIPCTVQYILAAFLFFYIVACLS